MVTNPMLPPQAPPVKVDPLTGKLVPANMPPPSPAALGLGFQGWAGVPENSQKVQQAMTSQFQPLQPNAGMSAAANPPPMAPMASSAPPGMAYDKTGVLGGQAIPGLAQRGNIDVNNRPSITNADGSHSSIYSMTVPVGGDSKPLPWGDKSVSGYALVPSIANGKFLTPSGKMPVGDAENSALEDAATAYYGKTGQHLGIFQSPGYADEYANLTHDYRDPGSLGQAGSPQQVMMPSPSIRSIVDNTQRNISAAPGADVTSPLALPQANNPMLPPGVQPSVRSQTGADQAELQRLQQSGAGLNRISNPWLRGAARALDIAGTIVAPGVASAIPGTTVHNWTLQNMQQGRVANDQAAQAADLAQQTGLAGLAHTQAETQNLLNPRDKFTPLQTPTGYAAFDPSVGTANPVLDASGQPVATPTKPEDVTVEHQYGQAVYDAIRRGVDPSKDPKVVQLQAALQGKTAEKPDTSAQDDQKYEGIITKQKLGQKITPEEGAFAAAYKDRKTLGQQVTNFYADKRGDTKADAATRQATFKAFEPAMDSAERFDIMTQSYEDAIKDPTNQQAMLNLLANHLGMTMGLQKGARLNQAIITEAQKSQPWLAGIKSHFGADGYMTGLTLTPAQMRSMVELAQGRYAGDVKKSRSQSQYLGATDDGPKRDPSASTQRYYFNLAGRDPAKARQMMKDDGWTF